MRRLCTLIFAGYISFTGFTAQAQITVQGQFSTGTEALMEANFQALTGAAGAEISTADLIDAIVADVMSVTESTGPLVSAIEGALTVETLVPEVNLATADVIDTRTNRYVPRVRINFAEFPLTSLSSASRSNNGHNGEVKTRSNIVAQRIQSRLRLPNVDLVVQDRTAVISGTVETERQRILAESMLRFEPGIDTIKNEIVVQP